MVSYSNPETLSADDLAGYEALGSAARDAIVAAAKRDAAAFAEEFPGEAIDTQGDWDSQAWAEAEREYMRDHGARVERARAVAGHSIDWAIYAEALHAEARRLADAA